MLQLTSDAASVLFYHYFTIMDSHQISTGHFNFSSKHPKRVFLTNFPILTTHKWVAGLPTK